MDAHLVEATIKAYASAILAGTPQAQLVTPQTPKRLKGMTAEAIARMERELSRLQEAISSIQDSYGQDHLHLTVVKGQRRDAKIGPKDRNGYQRPKGQNEMG
jgi:RepB plasmid partitioning protein